MATIPKTASRSGVKIKGLAAGAERGLAVDPPAKSENADDALLRDIDAILSRLDVGISRAHKSMDDLLERIRQPAA